MIFVGMILGGYDPFSSWTRSKERCPKIVHSFETFDGNNPVDLIKLLGAISNTSDYDLDKYGMLSAVI